MAERRSLAELGQKYAPQREAARKRVLAEWNRRFHEGERPPTTRELRSICIFLVENPELIGGHYAPFIYLVLLRWLKKTPPPKRAFSAKEIAGMVDLYIESGMSLIKARKHVAQSLRMEVEAVKQDHLRHGK
jgi:hypothetical protein